MKMFNYTNTFTEQKYLEHESYNNMSFSSDMSFKLIYTLKWL